VKGYLACPFCRELHLPSERLVRCSECGVELVRLETLGPSAEQLLAQSSRLEQLPPDLRLRSFLDTGAGRGPLLALSVLGLLGFFQPWVSISRPDAVTLSGFELAAGRVGWLWAGACGWLVLLALVLTRRTLRAMRGVRAIAVLLASLTGWEIAVLVVTAARGGGVVRTELHFEPWLWVSASVSLLGVLFGFAFGRVRASVAVPSPEKEGETCAPSQELRRPSPWLH